MSQTRIKRKKPSNGRRSSWYWMTWGTIAAYTTISGKMVAPAWAQQSSTPSTVQAPGQTRGLLIHQFDIPSGPLDGALNAFQTTTGVSVVVPKDSMRNIWSPGVSGPYTNEAALQKILRSTGLTYKFTSAVLVRLEIAGQSTSIDVTAENSQPSLPKYTQPLVDTPQTIDVIPQQLIQDQGATSLRDVLRNVAGISLAAGEGGAQGDNLTIRGFTARNDLFVDGMRDFGSYYRDPFDTENVAVLQGPSSVTFGRGSTGGVVNQQTKAPGLDRIMSGTAALGTDNSKFVTFDINRNLPSLGQGAAFRLNLMGNDSGVAGRDIAQTRRVGIAPSLAFGLGTSTRYIFSYFHQTADDTPDYGIPWFFNGPADVPRNNYYGFEHGNYLKTNVDMGTVKFEHDFGPGITFRNQARYAHYRRNARISEAQVPTTDINGDKITPLTPLDDLMINRHQIAVDSLETFLDDQSDVIFKFHTGFLKHTLIAGVEMGRETSAPNRPTYANCPQASIACVPQTSLLDPDPYQAFSGGITSRSIVHVSALTGGAYGLDTLQLSQRWELTLGGRVDYFDANENQITVPTPAAPPAPYLGQVVTMPSWRTALVFKPTPDGSIYFDAGTSFNPSAETLSLTAGTAAIPPESNRTFEVGTKWNLASSKLGIRAAVFTTNKLNARETSPTNSLLVVDAGHQRVNGVEAQLNGYLTKRWELMSGYAYLDGSVVSSQFFPAAVGAQLANVPRNTFTLWSNYDLPWHLGVGGGADFVDSRTASSTVPLDPTTGLVKQVPGYWVVNAMAKYPLTEHLELRANLYNITNAYYYDQIHPAHIVPGAARSALFRLNFTF